MYPRPKKCWGVMNSDSTTIHPKTKNCRRPYDIDVWDDETGAVERGHKGGWGKVTILGLEPNGKPGQSTKK
jgi:hypothetical protein